MLCEPLLSIAACRADVAPGKTSLWGGARFQRCEGEFPFSKGFSPEGTESCFLEALSAREGVRSLTHRRRHRFFHAGLAQKLRRFFRRRRIDVEARAPFESGSLRQLRHEFNVPVVVLVRRILRRRGMDDQIVRRIVEHRSAFISKA